MDIIRTTKNYLFGYTFIEQVAMGESYSTNIKIKRNLNGSLWVGKIARALPDRIENFKKRGTPYVRTVDFRDQNERAILGFRLARLAGLRYLKTKLTDADLIKNFNFSLVPYSKISNKIFLTEFKGQPLTSYLRGHAFVCFASSDIKNKEEAIKSFVLNLWIGNYDNKDRDYLVDENKNLISIDYHLLGPGFQSDINLAVGAWGESFSMDNPQDTGWSIGDGFLLTYLKNNTHRWQEFQNEIGHINLISKRQIKNAMSGLNFYLQGTNTKINGAFFNFLLERRPKLETAIKQWFAAGCPLTKLPKENGII
jgi:hypothetical protein